MFHKKRRLKNRSVKNTLSTLTKKFEETLWVNVASRIDAIHVNVAVTPLQTAYQNLLVCDSAKSLRPKTRFEPRPSARQLAYPTKARQTPSDILSIYKKDEYEEKKLIMITEVNARS